MILIMWSKFRVWLQNLSLSKKVNIDVDTNVVFSVNVPVSETILNLYEEATSSVATYANELDKLNHWNTSIKKNEDLLKVDDLNSFKILIGLQSLLLISMMDLAMISRSLFIARTIPERTFYIKHSYLLIHEFIVIFDRDRAQKLRNLLVDNYTIMSPEYKSAVKSLSVFKKTWKYESEMKQIRDKVSGHIDGNFELWYKIVNSFDIERCAQMIMAFLSVLNEFLLLCKGVQEKIKDKVNNDKNSVTNKLNLQLDDLEKVIQKVNDQQGNGSKLELDLTELRKLANL